MEFVVYKKESLSRRCARGHTGKPLEMKKKAA